MILKLCANTVLMNVILITLPCDTATKSLPYLIPLMDLHWGGLRLCNKTVLIWQMTGIRKKGYFIVGVVVCHLEGKDFDP